MSRLTGSNALGLFEAYQAVYAPQELTEEQVWEEVETWVNSLLEEGYDLSDYTWEEMYESYLSEMGQARTTGQNSSVFTVKTTPGAGSASSQGGGRGSGSSPGRLVSTSRPSGTSKPASKPKFGTTTPRGSSVTSTGVSGLSAADRAAYSAGGGNAAAQKGMGRTSAQVIAQGKTNLGRMDQGKPAPAGAKPTSGGSSTNPKSGLSAYSATKPSTTPSAKPAPSPAAKPSAAPAKATASAKPSNALASATAAASKPPAFNPSSTAEKKPSLSSQASGLRAMQQRSKERQGLTQSFDMFDVVKGYLIGEGYADTEEAALAIMANMSEEWKQSIIVEAI
jgi:hypothetical protein